MKKGLKKLADFLRDRPLILASSALICAVLGAVLLYNQVLLNRTVQTKLTNAEAQTLPSIHWYDEQTTAPAATTQTPVQSIETEPAAAEYVVNTNSKKIHKADCRYAESLKPENRAEAGETQIPDLLADGYTYCSVCCG
ncbi:MAG TPA: hypothetical protein IAD00_05845 [Candidatus Fimenecus stercoravium]|nr:hypothetical protein [Candidatus Fimenecus stercoravium]